MEQTLELEIPLLLPDIESEKDACVDRLLERIGDLRGVEKAHIRKNEEQSLLCLHFDPNLVSLDRLERLVEETGAEITERYRHETYFIRDMDCGDCAATIEHIVGRTEGVLDVSVSYAAETMKVEYDTNLVQASQILQRVRGAGYRIEAQKQPVQSGLRRHSKLVLSILSGIFLAAGYFGQFLGLPPAAAFALYLGAYATGGYDIARHGLKAALNFRFDIDFLMVVAAVGAAVVGEWAEGGFLLFLFSLGHALEHYATDRARRAIEALGEITPKTARVQRNEEELEISVEELQRGDMVLVRDGERIPIDGEILRGESAVDESPITGESVPVDKTPGDRVFAGSVNGTAALEIEVTKLAGDSTLARVLELVEEAQAQKSPSQRFAQKFTRVFVPVILVVTGLTIILPPLVGWLTWEEAFLRAMAVLVAASPCALAIATPSAVLSAIAQAARNGVLIKGGVHLENLGSLGVLAVDKTGTVTRGQPEVVQIRPFDTTTDELLTVAAAVETRSSHPLAEAIVREAEKQNLSFPEPQDIEAVTGRGVKGRLNGDPVLIGNLELFDGDEQLSEHIKAGVKDMEKQGQTTMLVKKGDRFLGIIGLADQPRTQAAATFQALRKLGVAHIIMITGDNERVAAAIAEKVGIREFRASLLPEEKVEIVRELRSRYGDLAMVGDGVNDAPAMKNSTVGIAMGASGTDVALETADIALMADDLSKLPFALELGRRSRRIIRQNLIISLGVILFLVPAALFGLAGIGIAIILHEGSTILVVGNALRLLKSRRDPEQPDKPVRRLSD